MEIYYRAQLNDFCDISPSLQYVSDTGAAGSIRDAVIFAVRVQTAF